MKLWTIALLTSITMACGGGSDKSDPDAPVGDTPDAGSNLECNPISQTGCMPGEKCAQVIIQEEEDNKPFIGQVRCVPAGDKGLNEDCDEYVDDMPGAQTGYDNCQPGLHCMPKMPNGEEDTFKCEKICAETTGDGCDTNTEVCAGYYNLFDVDGLEAGVCDAICHPVDQDCPPEDGACYNRFDAALGSCARIPKKSATQIQDDECYGPTGTTNCFLNGCALGHGVHLYSFQPDLDRAGYDRPHCAKYCTPQPVSNDPNVDSGNPQGDPNGSNCAGLLGNYECRYLNSFYPTDTVPATSDDIGICVPVGGAGYEFPSCTAADSTFPSGTTYDDLNPLRGCIPASDPRVWWVNLPSSLQSFPISDVVTTPTWSSVF